jgi:hypothetical protein
VQQHLLVDVGDAERVGGVGGRPALDIAQLEDLSLRGRQRLDRLGDAVEGLVAF